MTLMDVNSTNKKNKAVLVTGGAGFIGSHCVVELLEQLDSNVVVIDNLSNAALPEKNNSLPPSMSRVKSIVNNVQKEKLKFIRGNYGDKKLLESIFSEYEIETVIHFGGFKAVGESKRCPIMYYKNNVAGTLSLVKAMIDNDVKKIIFSSSATVYAEQPPEKLPLNEDSPTGNCTCPYASTKLFIENILRDVADSNRDWKVISLRYFNPVGAHNSGLIGEDPKGIPNNLMPFISQVAVGRRKELSVFGNDYPTPDGTGVRDYCHVVDIAKGHISALKALPKLGHGFSAFNLGSGKGTSVLEMAKTFEKASGVKIPIKIEARRPGDIASMFCDPTHALNVLGWKTEKSVYEMCQDLWNFQKNNPNGYASELHE